MKKFLLSVCVLLSLAGFAQAQKAPKVATVEVQTVLAQYKESILMSKSLETMVKQARDQSQGAVQRLKELQEEIEKLQKEGENPLNNEQGRTDAKAKATAKVQEYRKTQELALRQERSVAELLQTRQQENVKTVVGKIRPCIELIAKEKGVDLVLDSSFNATTVWFADKSFDITDEVVKRLNAAYDALNDTPAPAATPPAVPAQVPANP